MNGDKTAGATMDRLKDEFLEFQKQPSKTELTFNEGYLSIKDSLNVILANEEAKHLLMNIVNGSSEDGLNQGMLKMVGNMKLEAVIKMAGKKVPQDAKFFINAKLQEIKK